MSNHEIILNSINKSKKYSYDELRSISTELLGNTSASGKEYAILKFIQTYCDVFSNTQIQTIVRNGDPRKVLDKTHLKDCVFQLKNQGKANTNMHTGQTSDRELDSMKYDDHACCDKEAFNNITKEFRVWLMGALSKFDHEWVSRSTNIGIKKGTSWTCSSLFSAYQQYIWSAAIKDLEWDGRFFYETEECLGDLKERLEESMKTNDGEMTRIICRHIFEWGGVDDRETVSHNIKTGIPTNDLPQHLLDTQSYLNDLFNNGCSNSFNSIYKDSNGHQILLDSGTTKIYSLICDNFIIYDGRVASALGYLVRRWWEEDKIQGNILPNSYKEIPQCLRFSRAQENFRNPNPKGNTVFRAITNKGTRRVRENIQASWLLHQLLKDDEKQNNTNKSGFAYIKNKQTRLRALEAALFMIGYHVY
ncbi:hypothetical protein JYT79_03255 [Cardiobacterium sp. AH-315-I02]|nr:hypothetical protein [Cardiobacterium sp. AH-315-I02]